MSESEYHSYLCDGCGRTGSEDDYCAAGEPCPDEDCGGTCHLRGAYYFYDDESGMEYWHDHEFTRKQCHDGVGLITERHQSFDDFIAMFPGAEYAEAS